jgi:polysaccharide export outer membrane protein
MKTMFQSARTAAATLTVMGLLGLFLLSGCSVFFAGTSTSPVTKKITDTGAEAESRLRAGDPLQIRVETNPTMPPQLFEVTVDDAGDIALSLIGRVKAEGLTTTQLADKIQQSYMPRFYVRCTATVLAPVRYFYIGGEVRNPNRFPWSKDMTLLKAISTASGFTDFANRNKVEIARGRTKLVCDCEEIRRHPENDVPIQPGDSIYIPRTII